MISASPLISSRKAIVIVLVILALFANMSLQILLPSLPAIQSTFDATPAGVQLLVSLSFLVFGFAMLVYGPVADILGRRPVYLIGMVVYTCGNLICAVAPTLPLLISGRVIASAGSSVSMVLSRAIVRDLFSGSEMASVLARIAMVAAVAPMLSPPVGGVITDLLGWRALFLVLAGTGLLSVALIVFALPETLPDSARDPGRRFGFAHTVSSFGTLLRDRRYRAYALNGAFVASMFFVFMTTAPFIYVGVLHISATGYAFYYMTTVGGFFVGYVIAARAAGRVAMDRMLVLGSAAGLAAVCVSLAVATTVAWTAWSLTVPIIALTVASGTVTPNSQAAVVSGDPRTIGAASGLAGFLQMLVGGCLIQGVGLLPHETPYPMIIAMAVSGALGLGAIVWGVARPPPAHGS